MRIELVLCPIRTQSAFSETIDIDDIDGIDAAEDSRAGGGKCEEDEDDGEEEKDDETEPGICNERVDCWRESWTRK